MRTLNLGILAHVDAGKTTLTERLLYAAGVIDEIGSVDAGSTHTDYLALERQRGITIRSAVVSFVVGDVTINLIDTPGHPDFIAEVERVLNVLDGAILVISAVEGVQAQTRVLMRTLQRLRIPTLLFVNKIDRTGARREGVVQEISEKLTPAIVAMGTTDDLGSRTAVFAPSDDRDPTFLAALTALLADHDEAILAAYVDDRAPVPYDRLMGELAAKTKQSVVHPIFFGSAITGAGIDPLTAAITQLLPSRDGNANGPASGTVFKVERGPAGEKVAYVRMFSGSIRTRDRMPSRDGEDQKVTAIRVFESGSDVQRDSVTAGQIGKVWGLSEVQIGDGIGVRRTDDARQHFAPPTLETVILPSCPQDKAALHTALVQLAEQDPLINLRQDDTRQELFVSLYGEVQKEVIQATLALEYGIDVTFRETKPICVERPVGIGSAVELLGKNPFLATIGLRVEPARLGAGITFAVDVDVRTIPLYVYKTVDEFTDAMTRNVTSALGQGLYGWQVVDCAVVMVDCDYLSPGTKSYHFRKLTPLVVMAALKRAGTVVCEPIHRFRLECPLDTLGSVLSGLGRLQAVPEVPATRGSSSVIEGSIAAARMHELQYALRGLTHGEGVLEFEFDRYEPVHGPPPTRPRTDHNPLNPKEYLREVTR